MKNLKRIVMLFVLALMFSINLCFAYTVGDNIRANMKINYIKTDIPDDEVLVSNENELGVVVDAVVYSKPSSIYEFFDNDKRYNLVYSTEDSIYWSVFDNEMNVKSTVSTNIIYDKSNVQKDISSLTFTVGGSAYYNGFLYVIYARVPDNAEENALAIVKYDRSFKMIAKKEIPAKYMNEMQIPFYASNCSISINSKTDVLSVFFGKNNFDGKQDSSLLFFDTNTLKLMNEELGIEHSSSNSLGQRVLATSDGGFILAESVDGGENRGLNISQINPKKKNPKNSKIMFNYKEGLNTKWGQNSTYQALGNILELPDGYLYIGGAEKTLDTNYGNPINESWDVFAQKYKKEDFENKEIKDLQLLEAPERKCSVADPDEDIGKLFLKGDEIDYGVKWLTDLQNESTTVFVRALKVDNDIAILWQEAPIVQTQDDRGYEYNEKQLKTYYMIVDKDAEIVSPKAEIIYAGKLSVEERYIYKDGKIYWATASGNSKNIAIHILDIYRPYTHPYKDCRQGAWYSEAVQYTYQEELLDGASETEFGLNDAFTKGMMAEVLYRLAKTPETTNSINFVDVPKESKYYDSVNWVVDAKIASVFDNQKFGIDESITREDLMVMLYRYSIYTEKDVSKTHNIGNFTDAWKISYYALEAMKWGVANGIIKGNKGEILPQSKLTKAEFAVIIRNYGEKYKSSSYDAKILPKSRKIINSIKLHKKHLIT